MASSPPSQHTSPLLALALLSSHCALGSKRASEVGKKEKKKRQLKKRWWVIRGWVPTAAVGRSCEKSWKVRAEPLRVQCSALVYRKRFLIRVMLEDVGIDQMHCGKCSQTRKWRSKGNCIAELCSRSNGFSLKNPKSGQKVRFFI